MLVVWRPMAPFCRTFITWARRGELQRTAQRNTQAHIDVTHDLVDCIDRDVIAVLFRFLILHLSARRRVRRKDHALSSSKSYVLNT